MRIVLKYSFQFFNWPSLWVGSLLSITLTGLPTVYDSENIVICDSFCLPYNGGIHLIAAHATLYFLYFVTVVELLYFALTPVRPIDRILSFLHLSTLFDDSAISLVFWRLFGT